MGGEVMWNLILIGVGVALLIGLAWAWKKYGEAVSLPSAVSSTLDTASAAIVKAGDIASVVASYTSLTAIRRLDSVEADPKAVEACDYLRGVITAWRRPVEEKVKPAHSQVACGRSRNRRRAGLKAQLEAKQ